jgi:monovalent cation:H+ antiporter, CPA1 family
VPAVESIIAGFLLVAIIASIISRKINVPYTQFLVILGIVLASFSVSSLIGIGFINNLVSGGYFVALVLPPLLFEAMMNLRSTELKSVIRPALALATVGVVVATVVGGSLLYLLAGIPLGTAFLFSALIAPTDTATVLEIFKRAKVPSKLRALMETEAALNDATGIVVFSVILASLTVSQPSLVRAGGAFVYLLGGGAAIGLLVGFGCELLSSLVDDPISETLLTVVCVYGSYSLASYLGLSGLVAVAIAGLYFGNLTMRTTVRESTRGVVRSFWQTIAFVANSVAFLFIGLSTDVLQLVAGALAILVAFLAVSMGRAAAVYSILGVFSRTAEKIPRSWRNVAMLGGMRGALSIVLLGSIPASTPARDTVVTMVLGVAFLSITLQGPLLYRYAGSRFPDRRAAAKGEAEARLSAFMFEAAQLRELRRRAEISEEELATRLAAKEQEIAQLLQEAKPTNQTTMVLKSRARGIVSFFKRRRKRKKEAPPS